MVEDRQTLDENRIEEDAGMHFTVSSRWHHPMEIVQRFERHGSLDQLKRVYGFLFDSPLNGGRLRQDCITFAMDVIDELNEMGIGYSFTLNNLTVAREYLEDAQTNRLLERFEHPLNGVIVAHDDVADHIRRRFPGYKLRASCIYDFTELDVINEACEMFDEVCLFPEVNDRPELLGGLKHPEKITLFATSVCLNLCGKKRRHHYYLLGQDHIAYYNHMRYDVPYRSDAFARPRLPWCRAHAARPRLHDIDALAAYGIGTFKVTQLEVFTRGWFHGEDVDTINWTKRRLSGGRLHDGFLDRLKSVRSS